MNLAEKNITELVGDNYSYASTLYYLGIKFYHYPQSTLQEVCRELGLDTTKVVANLEAGTVLTESHNWAQYPIEILVEYLKHAHNLFIKRKLPYISGLMQGLNSEIPGYEDIIRDLRFVLPHFIEDFILHIYEEEDTLLRYITILQSAKRGKFNPARLFYEMEKYSIEEFALEHAAVDDDMTRIRNITLDYRIDDTTDLHLKVIYSELLAFERELIKHAHIENDILFPKAMALEAQVKGLLQLKARSN